MEKKMDTTIVYRGYIEDNGKEKGNYHSILWLYRGKWKRRVRVAPV